MILKFITKFIRSFGLYIIFFHCIFFIFASVMMRDMDKSTLLSRVLDYTSSFEGRFYDLRMKNQLDPAFKSQDIVLINIDDYSLQSIGVWPLPRSIHADMINKLKHFGAKVVALDILYPEKAPVCGPVSPDTTLAQAFTDFQANGGRVFLACSPTADAAQAFPEAPVEMLNDTVDIRSSSEVQMYPYHVDRFTFPIQEFLDASIGVGSIMMEEDYDGIFRQYQLIYNVDTIYFGSLGFNAWEAFTGEKHTVSVLKDGRGQLDLQGKVLELNHRGETKVRFVGGMNAFPNISLADLIKASDEDQKMHQILKGKMVFVGSSATGAHDLRPSPIDPKMPGVLMHMNIANMLVNKYFFQHENESLKYSLIFLVLGFFSFYFIQKFGNPFLDLLFLITALCSTYALDYFYFLPNGFELKLFYCYLCFLASYSWNTFLKFSEANKEKKQIRGTFARYVAPTIVDEMLKEPDLLQVGGFKRDITCLFSDVRDFTSISEGLTATELAHSLNMYMGKMTDIVFDTKGTLDKYIGDAIVAFWGAPLEIGNHAQHAVEGAIKMMEALPLVNEEFKKLGRPEFRVGIGLNSGECSVGNMGSDRIFSYTALGDNMNLGARLESLCKHYGAHILISEYTLARVDLKTITYRPIDKVIVKGKTTSVSIFEVLHSWHPMTIHQEAFQLYNKAWENFQKKDFSGALEFLKQVLVIIEEDKPTKRLRDLCQLYVSHPDVIPEKFDVTKMTEK